MTMWILASAMAFSAVEFVRMPLASVRTQTLPVSQPAEQRWQPAVVLLQSSSPLFAVRGAVRLRHVGKAPTASAAAWLVPCAFLAAAPLLLAPLSLLPTRSPHIRSPRIEMAIGEPAEDIEPEPRLISNTREKSRCM